MNDEMDQRSRLAVYIEYIGIVVFHLIVVFIIANLGAWAILEYQAYRDKKESEAKVPMRHKRYNEALGRLYPGLTEDEVNNLISDTRRIPQEYEAYTQFKESTYRSKYVNTDQNGFRLTKDQGPWPPSKEHFNVFFFGGSTGFGYGLPDHQTVASFLQDILVKEGGLPAKVYNFGRASYFSVQERILFGRLVQDGFVPNMAIFLDGTNEFVFRDYQPGYTPRLKKWLPDSNVPLGRRVWRELPLPRLFVKWFGEKSEEGDAAGQAKKQDLQPWLRQTIDRYEVNMRMIKAISREFGITPVFVWQPHPLHKYDLKYHLYAGFDYDGLTPFSKAGFTLMSEVRKTRSYGDNFIWCADIAEDFKEPLYVSAFHYGPKMAKMVAQSIFEAMAAQGLLPSAPKETRHTPAQPKIPLAGVDDSDGSSLSLGAYPAGRR